MIIKKQPISAAEAVKVDKFLWLDNDYKPEVEARVALDDDAFRVRFDVKESDPRREVKEQLKTVCVDSCVEWFVKFCPDTCDRYFNFEVNPNGMMDVSFRLSRADKQPLELADVESFDIRAEVLDDSWSVEYKVPFTTIKKYIPQFNIAECDRVLCNFYKCGDKTEVPHYACWNLVGCEKPNFHAPEYFAEVKAEY